MKIVIGLFFTLAHLIATAQEYTTLKTASKKSISRYQEAMEKIGLDQLREAETILRELTQGDEKFIDAFLLLGELQNINGNYMAGKTSLEKVITLNPDYSSKAWFFLSESNWQLQLLDECIISCQKFLAFVNISVGRQQQALQMLANSEFSKHALLNPVPFEPVNMGNGINTIWPEYLPSISGDGSRFLFTRKTGSGLQGNEDFFESIWLNNEWTNAQALTAINTEFNEGAQSLSANGRYLFFTACDKPGGYGSCDLYYSEFNNRQWSKVRNAGTPLNSPSWETQPAVSSSGNEIFFASGRPGGKGGSDIWMSRRTETGHWSAPENLGDSINTSADDRFPFIHPDGKTLYYSTSGHAGMGNDDIFFSRKHENGKWSKPVNIGYPVNSRADDNSFIVSLDGSTAYFATDRMNEAGNTDLYYFSLYENAQPHRVSFVKGIISDAESDLPVSGAYELISLTTGKQVERGIANSAGEYFIALPSGEDYALNVSADGYLFYSENFSLKESTPEKPYRIDVPLLKIKEGSTVVLRNIFFNTGSFELKAESEIELNKLVQVLNENPHVKIEISGHTDDVGSEEANQLLSRNRAKSVYDFLLAKNIDSGRISYQGYGETKPVAANSTEEGRRNNRRTEFTITGLQHR